jgi:DNA-binding IclR family transcriptional regulator
MDDEEIDRLRPRMKLVSQTPATITTWEELQREVRLIRKRGYAFDRDENSLGISAVAVAIRNPSGEIAAISIPAPTQRFSESETDLTESLLRHVSRLQDKLSRR